jgi:uncharacterized glyoxalase superfamily protein PhnB
MAEMKKLTPVLVVEEIEPCLGFWMERLGFAKTVEVPEGDKLGFVILVKDSVEVMYQTYASVEKDIGHAVPRREPATNLYIEVRDLDDVIRRLAGANIVLPERKTFYGAREIGAAEPGGNLVMFAEFEKK